MKIIPISNFRQLGTSLELKAGETYNACNATNQPDWKAKGLIFVDANDLGDSILLEKGNYTIVPEETLPPVPKEAAPPVPFTSMISHLLAQLHEEDLLNLIAKRITRHTLFRAMQETMRLCDVVPVPSSPAANVMPHNMHVLADVLNDLLAQAEAYYKAHFS